MKDLMKTVAQVKRDLDSLGIKYRAVREWSVNTRAKKRWGCCRSLGNGIFDISINAALLEDGVEDQKLKDTVAHELLHTVEGCFGHRGPWNALAKHVNLMLPGYSISRATSAASKGVAKTASTPVYRYALVCDGCGQRILRQKLSHLIRSPWRYRCGKCGGKLRRIQ